MLAYLSIPYSEKEEAKKHGARWDPKRKLWFAPKGEKELLDRWPLNNSPIIELIGEDREFGGNILFVDLVPASCWFTNVRKCVHFSDWDRLRYFVYERANNQCECCQAKAILEAHERWYFDTQNKIQKLMRIIALCESCHETTHMGLAQIRGRGDIAIQHLMNVVGINKNEAKSQVDKAFKLWGDRNKFEWELDLTIITNSGIKLSDIYNKKERKDFSEAETKNVRMIENSTFENHLFLSNEHEIIAENSIAETYESISCIENEVVIEDVILLPPKIKLGLVQKIKKYFMNIFCL